MGASVPPLGLSNKADVTGREITVSAIGASFCSLQEVSLLLHQNSDVRLKVN